MRAWKTNGSLPNSETARPPEGLPVSPVSASVVQGAAANIPIYHALMSRSISVVRDRTLPVVLPTAFCPQHPATFKGKRIPWLLGCLRSPSNIAIPDSLSGAGNSLFWPSLQLNPTLYEVPSCVSFSKLTFGFPIAKKLRMSSFSATLSVTSKSCSASGSQLKRVYTERSIAHFCDLNKSSTVNPKGRFKLTLSTPPSPYEVSPGRCCLSGGSPCPVGPYRVRERHSFLPELNDK